MVNRIDGNILYSDNRVCGSGRNDRMIGVQCPYAHTSPPNIVDVSQSGVLRGDVNERLEKLRGRHVARI